MGRFEPHNSRRGNSTLQKSPIGQDPARTPDAIYYKESDAGLQLGMVTEKLGVVTKFSVVRKVLTTLNF